MNKVQYILLIAAHISANTLYIIVRNVSGKNYSHETEKRVENVHFEFLALASNWNLYQKRL